MKVQVFMAFVTIVLSASAGAVSLTVDNYTIYNGGTGDRPYYDNTYTGSGNSNADYS